MEVNNTIYETCGHGWWEENAGFEFTSLRYCVNPVRYGYFRGLLQHLQVPGKAVLDVGCGGGFLAEAFARDGYQVTGIDPAARTIAAAHEHAESCGLNIRYEVARGEALPFAAAAFDVVACCDALEHVDEPAQVIREIARVLKPGGVFFFDTVNRTRRSKLVLIKVWQDWNLGGFAEPNMHVWEKFIKPEELSRMLRAAGLEPGGMTGMGPKRNPLALISGLLRIRAGRLQGDQVAEIFGMRETEDLEVSYMGWATRHSTTK